MRKILVVDDEQSILEITSLFLKKHLDAEVIIASSGNEALTILNTDSTIDAIVSDYDMPLMNGLDLLEEIRSSNKDLAFILFTGRGREEVAIKALNDGADFYLQKGGDPRSQFTELANLVRRSINARENILTLKYNEEMFRDFFEYSSDPILIIKDRIIINCNKELIRQMGYSQEEIIGLSLSHLSPEYQIEDRSDLLADKYLQMAEEQKNLTFLWKHLLKDGSIRDFEVRLLAFSFQHELIIHAVLRDVTEQMRKEHLQQLTQLRLETLLTLHSMRDRTAKEITDYVLDRAVQVTESEYGYIAFVQKDETELEMYSWSVQALEDCRVQDKPMIYQVEKTGLWGEPIRQRKTVISNDYTREETLKKGIPGGHVPITRHMGVPVFHGDRVVIVAGVANKLGSYTDNDADQLILLLNGLWDLLAKKKIEDELNQKNEELAAAYEELLATDEELRKLILQKDAMREL